MQQAHALIARRPLMGFSLVELMIVLVIIAVLASIAIPGFQDQVARSHVMGGLSELRSLTTAYEDFSLRGIDSFDLNDLGLEGVGTTTRTTRCEMSLTTPDADTGEGGLSCILQGNPRIASFELKLDREGTQGRWICRTDLPERFRPAGCVSNGD
ncbi:MAG TPA: pilin [Wenzhouxiangella sp.]